MSALHVERLGKPLNSGKGFPHPYREPAKTQLLNLAIEDCDRPGVFVLCDEVGIPTLLETGLPDAHWWNTLEPMSRAERWQSGADYFDIAEALQRLASAAPDGPVLSADEVPIICPLERLTAEQLAWNITGRPLDSPGIRPLLEEAARRVAVDCAWRVNDFAAVLNAGGFRPADPEPFDDWPEDEPPAPAEMDPLPEEHAPRFKLLTAAELAALPPMRELVRGVLPATGLGAMFGPSGSGKSFLVLDLLGAVTTGRDWFGHAIPNACKAVYVALEGEAGVSKRVAAFMAKHGPLDGLRVILSPLDIRLANDRAALVAAIKAEGFSKGVLCLDTLNRAAAGMDENDSRDMGEVIGALKEIQAELGGVVVAVHHSGKDPLKGLRGHSSLLAALDCVIEVTRQEERREWKLSKSKDGEDGNAHPFTLEVVELGEDGDGWPVTSCTIRPEEQAADVVGRAKVPSGGNQRILWDGIGELLRDSHHFGQGEAPPTRPCIQLEEAISQLRGRLAVTTDRQTERARQAITRLVSRGLLNLRDGWLWCA
jgi:hypothetical protein